MTLTLSKAQKKYLNKSGIMDAETLQSVFKKSIQDQEKLRKQAAKIRSKSN